MTVKQNNWVGGDLGEDAWNLYRAAFADLNTHAVQRHLLYRDEFAQVMLDGRVGKYLRLDDAGQLDGLATYTNHLDAVPLISPAYFAHHYPDQYRTGRIWYVGFVAVADTAPVTAFPELIEAMHLVSGLGALTVLDVCSRMRVERHLPRSVEALLGRLSGPVRMRQLDEQSYWLYQCGN